MNKTPSVEFSNIGGYQGHDFKNKNLYEFIENNLPINTTKPIINQDAALVGKLFLNTTSITTITKSKVGNSFSILSCLPVHMHSFFWSEDINL